ncbi:hypothetical protein L2Y90_12935 [Burkholderia pyrrocinia]|uniref:hypothetical protein n=1 Tax=Burkholderia pyrrocinia TaxID=60550 RepID=UPI00215AA325|nr:hypothetical protein [Burkholderia pyrrocinia]UVE64753.1 hypothetical protein L2Y90_12935 [Burkholderia pyrrocinia]
MSIFSKQDSKPEMTGAKRDVTIRNEPKKRPDHVIAETDDAQWTIPLTIDEQSDLAYAYEELRVPEQSMLETFVQGVYGNSAAKLSIELRPHSPGKVTITAGRNLKTLAYADVGETILRWILEAQSRKDLVADLVAAIPTEKIDD